MHLQGAPGSLPAGAPDLADDLFAAEDHAGPLGEEGQQVELLAGQLDLCVVDADAPGWQLYLDGPQTQCRDGGRRGVLATGGAPGDRVDTGEQLTGVVGLGDVVVGAEVESVDARADVGTGGDHDHRGRGALADLAADLVAVLVGQAEVEQDDAEGLLLRGQQRAQGLLAVAGVHDLEPVPGEHGGQGRRDMVVVLDEQQSHGPPLRLPGRGDVPYSFA
ncbi:hypothetical protein SMICM17S_12079 [Streptomyces microflavus]